ncbi:hypothetical protein JDV02_005753 [Purpureocillium takamizusanense]|uniref:Uncharacterized protein n=1 Tax=Purpureocillium takamizusanense TaxID=2060973 RepID=A0A9Q8QH85_9HYPO|nr:uncharacterized protein JDV02_005753 [Purpureocillium takamizusanense]UNI19575.1 hypothetical protein JDV02_005753 [Purpureocillium takamizusanense]
MMPAKEEPPQFAPPRNPIDRDIAARLRALWRRSHRRWHPAVRAEFKALTPIARVTRGTYRPSSHLIVRKYASPRGPYASSSSSSSSTPSATATTTTRSSSSSTATTSSAVVDRPPLPSYAVFLVLVTMFGLRPLMAYEWWDAFHRKHPYAATFRGPGAVPANAAQVLLLAEKEEQESAATTIATTTRRDRAGGRGRVAVAATSTTAVAEGGNENAYEAGRYEFRGSARRMRKVEYRKRSGRETRKEQRDVERKEQEKRDEERREQKQREEEEQRAERRRTRDKKHNKERKDEKKPKEKKETEPKTDKKKKKKQRTKDTKNKDEPAGGSDKDNMNEVVYISSTESSPVKRIPSTHKTTLVPPPAPSTQAQPSNPKRDNRNRDPDAMDLDTGRGNGGETTSSAPRPHAEAIPPPVRATTTSTTTAESQGQRHGMARGAAGSPTRAAAPRGPRMQSSSRGHDDMEHPRDAWQARHHHSTTSGRTAPSSRQTYPDAYAPSIGINKPQDTPFSRRAPPTPSPTTAAYPPQGAATHAPRGRPATASTPNAAAPPAPAGETVWDSLFSRLQSGGGATTPTPAAPSVPPAQAQGPAPVPLPDNGYGHPPARDLRGQIAELRRTNKTLWGRIGRLEDKVRRQALEMEVLTGRVQMLAEVVMARQARG